MSNRIESLLQKANSLPCVPGIYIMKDRNQKIIYVGKSRSLKNRVSQYFQNNQKNEKTSRMVSLVHDFDYILCKTEIEALALENTLIKQYTPKYNIRLKDAKSYPYIKITAEEYPRIVFTRSRVSDKGKYFGPFSGTSVVFSILDIIHKTLGLPTCNRKFPKDIGKERPCIYYQMNQCCGVCTRKVSKDEYQTLLRYATEILRGDTLSVTKELEEQMLIHAENERFEAAARCRDTIRALERLHEKQSVVADPNTNVDIFGFYSNDLLSVLSAIYIRNGMVTDKNDWCFGHDIVFDESTWSTFLIEHYSMCDHIPPAIMVSFDLDPNEQPIVEAFLQEKVGRKVSLKKPERGTFKALCDMAIQNAKERAKQRELEVQRDESVLLSLANLLHLESVPERIEAYDISNIGGENVKAGMVVFENGKPAKSEYRSFSIRCVTDMPDDYASMREAITRRIQHLKNDPNGSFAVYPDLLLIDGGQGHVSTVKDVLRNEGIEIPVFGMVKDDFHKTRALCTEHEEINIAKEKNIFMLIYRIQEEVHRYTVGQTTAAKRKTLKHSSLEKIPGIGPVKAKKLLLAFSSLQKLKEASIEEIQQVKGISEQDATKIYHYFHQAKGALS